MYNLCCFVVKLVLSRFTHFCRKICFVAIYALLCGEKLNQKLPLWRKNDKYKVWSIGPFFILGPRPNGQSLSEFLLVKLVPYSNQIRVKELLRIELNIEILNGQEYNLYDFRGAVHN